MPGKIWLQDASFSKSEDGFIVVSRLFQMLDRNDAVGNINTGLGSHLKI